MGLESIGSLSTVSSVLGLGGAFQKGLVFLLNLAWNSRFRLPVLITVGFMVLDVRMQLEINVDIEVRHVHAQDDDDDDDDEDEEEDDVTDQAHAEEEDSDDYISELEYDNDHCAANSDSGDSTEKKQNMSSQLKTK